MPRSRRYQEPYSDREWHLDKRIPLSLIATMAMQTFVVAYWAAGVTGDISTLKSDVQQTRVELKERSRQGEEVTALKIEMGNVKETVTRIETAISRAIEKLEDRITDRRASREPSSATPQPRRTLR